MQGFGNVGSYAAKFLHEYGAKIIAVSDVTGGLYDPEGLDIPTLFDYNYENRTIDGFDQGTKITNEKLLALNDFLIPAALGSAINDKNVDSVNCKVIIEAANGPVTGEAATKLWKRKVAIIPDILTNAGGVTVSYFEWVQNLQQFKWTEKEVNDRLEAKMVNAFNEVYEIKKNKKVPMRIASFMVAIDRVYRSYLLRGGVSFWKKKSKIIKLYTDGACKENPGIGGWGVLIKTENQQKELSGFSENTTNNRMELVAVIEGLKYIQSNMEIVITTDSQYVKNGINQWIINWKKNGWKTASKKTVKNKDLWVELDNLVQNKKIEWKWVKGHSGHPGNEKADQLANLAIEKSVKF